METIPKETRLFRTNGKKNKGTSWEGELVQNLQNCSHFVFGNTTLGWLPPLILCRTFPSEFLEVGQLLDLYLVVFFSKTKGKRSKIWENKLQLWWFKHPHYRSNIRSQRWNQLCWATFPQQKPFKIQVLLQLRQAANVVERQIRWSNPRFWQMRRMCFIPIASMCGVFN